MRTRTGCSGSYDQSEYAEVFTKRKTASFTAGLIRALPYLLHILFYAFPLVSSRAFQAFECEEFDDGTRFLRVDYSLDCNDDEHGRVVALAWVAIALYPIGIPLLYLALLLSARKAILTEQPTDLSRSLTFHPAASDVVMEAAIKDILDKLERGAELLQGRSDPSECASIVLTVLLTARL